MDSDGAVERVSVPNGINSTHTDLDDGKWHMITVTTISEEKKGFRIYVDGELTAETPDNGGTRIATRSNIALWLELDFASLFSS